MPDIPWSHRPWQHRLQYRFWDNMIHNAFGTIGHWNYCKHNTLPDQYSETMKDLISMYCMGGEL